MKTKIMGILNVTPDSFSDGGLYFNKQKAIKRAKDMIKEGADIVDIGGESTRPGFAPVLAEEEIKRVLPILKSIKKSNKYVIISVDTRKSEVAEECLKAGANIINSLGGFTFDKDLAKVAAKHKCAVVLYHIKGGPKTMQSAEITYYDIIAEIKEFFDNQISYGVRKGIKREKFILDPGIGFGKTVEHNLEIIRRFNEFQEFKLPLLVGVSRKSHLGIIIKEELGLNEIPSPQERVEAGLAEVSVAVLNGVGIIRTHDVLQTKKFLSVLDRLK